MPTAETPVIGRGITLGYATTSGGSYTAIASINNMTPPEVTVDKVENKTYDLTFGDNIPGWMGAGDAEFDINFDKTQSAAIYALLDGVTTFWWKMTYLDGSTLLWSGFVIQFGTEVPLKERCMNKIKIAVKTKPVFTAGS